MKPLFKYLLIATALYTALFFTVNYFVPFNPGTMTADSGWDSDYDSGGSDWGGSDYGGGGDYGGYDSGGYGGYGSSGSSDSSEFLFLFLTTFQVGFIIDSATYYMKRLKEDKKYYIKYLIFNIGIVIAFSVSICCFLLSYDLSKHGRSNILILFYGINAVLHLVSTYILKIITPDYLIEEYKKHGNYNRSNSRIKDETMSESTYEDGPIALRLCPKDKLKKAGIEDVEKLKDTLYKVFVDVQMAWMEFDYDALENLCSNELYNSYKSDLEILKLKNGKNIMSDFEIIKIGILKADKDEEKTTIQMVLEVTFHDYVINEKTGNVIRGSKSTIMRNVYLLDYVKYHKTVSTCPSCGAKLKKNSNKKCEHCGCVVVNNNKNFVLTHKERI